VRGRPSGVGPFVAGHCAAQQPPPFGVSIRGHAYGVDSRDFASSLGETWQSSGRPHAYGAEEVSTIQSRWGGGAVGVTTRAALTEPPASKVQPLTRRALRPLLRP
jgi:hypothetical protein